MFSKLNILSCATASAIALGGLLALSGSVSAQPATPASKPEPSADVQKQIAESVRVIEQMKTDPRMMSLLKQAKGVFVVPTYVRAALGVGARGGEGVMLARQGQAWTSPLFYNVGGVSIGLQAGGEAGPVVMLLMNDKAVNEFKKENNFALNADAGLTLVNYNAKALGGTGQGDVVVWSNTKGAFVTAAVAVVDIHFDDSDNRAYYRKPVKAMDVLSGNVKDAQAGTLANALNVR